jgi:hypothetical protein
MSISNDEKDRRAKKKLYEKVDSIFDEVMDDPEFSKEIVQSWAKADPRGFMQLMEKRLPKVQAVDQDLQRTLISLKSMMLDLPDFDDVALALKKTQADLRRITQERDNYLEQVEFLNKKLKKLKCQTK